MSIRAIVIGLLLAMLVAVGGHFNDVYMQQTYMVGNFFPISVVGVLLLLVLVINPLVWRISPRLKFRAAELAVILALPLTVCVVPGSGFLRTFTPVMVLPHHYAQLDTSWQKNEVMSYVPDKLLAGEESVSEEELLGSFLQGKGSMTSHIGLDEIPWRAWMPCLRRWIPLFLIMMIGLIGLALVLHRQWTTHEHLVYPVAEFIQSLTRGEPGSGLPNVVRSRLFWYGFVAVALVHMVNGLHAWYPASVIIPHYIRITPLRELFPRIVSGWGSSSIFSCAIYFSVVAFAYFLPSDITLSLGLSHFLGVALSATLVTYGVTATYNWIGDGEIQGLLFGAYVGMTIMILYTGRKYFGHVALAALRLRRQTDPVEPSAVWGARVFVVAELAALRLMVWMGMAWPLALLVLVLLLIMFTVMSRVCAETGLFFMQPSWQAVGVMLGLLGSAAIGPRMLIVGVLMCLVISIDPRECMMPFVVNALRIAENANVKRGRLAAVMGGTLALGLIAGLACVLWLQYDRGVGLSDSWATRNVPKMGFDLLNAEIQELAGDGRLETAVTASGWERIRAIQPDKGFMTFLGCGFLLFTSCALLRLRFSKWPLHPVLFLVWFTYPLSQFAWSFFIGWIVKSLVVKFGGGSTYQRVKPLMIGVIAGDLAGGLVFIIVGIVYYLLTGFPPRTFSIFPG